MINIVSTYNTDELTIGLGASLTQCDFNFKFWMPQSKPAFDMFDEIKPDIFFLHPEFVNPVYDQVFEEYPNTKFILISDKAVALQKKPDVVFRTSGALYQLDQQSNYNCPKIPWKYLANVAQYHHGEVRECFKTDIIYISKENHPRQDIVNNILPQICDKYNIKIFGNKKIDLPQYLGRLDIKETADALASAKLCLSIMDNTKMDASINGCPSLCELQSKDPWECFENVPDTLCDKLDQLLGSEDKRKSVLKKTRKHVLDGNTYFHHVAKAFEYLEMKEEAEHCLKKLEEIL